MFRSVLTGFALSILAIGFCNTELAMAQTVTKYFCAGSDNNWGTNSNWRATEACGGAVLNQPDADDVAVIVAGKTCNVNVSNATAGHVEVRGTAILNIDAGSSGNDRILTLTRASASDSIIAGTLNLQGGFSKLIFTTNSHTLTGSGIITGYHDQATIDFSGGGIDLTSQVHIEGEMQVMATDVTNTFTNGNVVEANRDGVLLFENLKLNDTSSAVWKVSTPPTSGTPVLRLNHVVTNPAIAALAGDFEVRDGVLDIRTSTETSGTLLHYGGKITTDSVSHNLFGDVDDPGAECVDECLVTE